MSDIEKFEFLYLYYSSDDDVKAYVLKILRREVQLDDLVDLNP